MRASVFVSLLMVASCAEGPRRCAAGCMSGTRCDVSTDLCVRDDGDGGSSATGGGNNAGGTATAGGASGGTAGGTSGGTAGGTSGGTAGGASGGAAGGTSGGTAGGSTIPAPMFTLTSPTMVIASATVELVGEVTQSAGREVTMATIDGVAMRITGTTWRATVSVSVAFEGMQSLTIEAVDASGAMTVTTVTILVDTLGPRAAVTTSQTLGRIGVLEGSVSDPAGALSVRIDVGVDAGLQLAALDGGSWFVSVAMPLDVDGLHSVTLVAVDSLSNTSTATARVPVDTRGPVLTLTSHDAGTVVGRTVVLVGSAIDSSGPVTNFTVGFGAAPTPVSVVAGQWTKTETPALNINRQPRSVVLSGQDPLGNVSSTSVELVIDTAGPSLSASWPVAAARPVYAGGADHRDPLEIGTTARFWRRHDVLPVTIQSPSPDLNSASVELTVGGVRVATDGGSSCSFDGGFCRVFPFSLATPPLPGLRGTFEVETRASDHLGNMTTEDAGTVGVTRWMFSFDGGASSNSFSMAETGELVVPNAGQQRLKVLRPDGRPLIEWATQYGSLRFAPVGRVRGANGRLVYALGRNGTITSGEAFWLDSPSLPPVIWAAALDRPDVALQGPVLRSGSAEEEVAQVYRTVAQKPAATWASVIRQGASQFGNRVASPSALLIDPPGNVVASGGRITATDGTSLFGFAGSPSPSTFNFLEERGMPYRQTLGAFSVIRFLAATTTSEIVGAGYLPGMTSGFFRTVFPSTTLEFRTGDFWTGTPLVKGMTVYFASMLSTGTEGRVCKAALTGPMLCTPVVANEIPNEIALGAGDTVYAFTFVTNGARVDVIDAVTMTRRWSVALSSSDLVHSLTPTCLEGVPVLGFARGDTVTFVATDSRGVDTTAEWPMLGHDPSRTWNQSTPLTPFTCP